MIVPVLLAVALALLLSVAAFFILWLDRYGTQPVIRLALVAGWGLACPYLFRLADGSLGLVGSQELPSVSDLLPASVGLLAQVLLAAALALVATSNFLEGPVDGTVYGTVAGLGLAVSENLIAVGTAGPASWPVLPFFLTMVEAAAAAVVGAGIGIAKLAARPALRVPCALAAVGCAGLLRWALLGLASWGCGSWGSRNAPVDLALVVLAAGVLCGVLLAALAFERLVLAAQLGEEVKLGVLPGWVAEVLPSYRRRVRSGWWPERDERREIVRLLTALAYRKHHLRGLPDESARLYGLEVGRLRQRARTLMALAPSGAAEDGDAGATRPPGGEEATARRG
jgi:hypothetical protein